MFPQERDEALRLRGRGSVLRGNLCLFLCGSYFCFVLVSVHAVVDMGCAMRRFNCFAFSFAVTGTIVLLLSSFGAVLFPGAVSLVSSSSGGGGTSTLRGVQMNCVLASRVLICLTVVYFPVLM